MTERTLIEQELEALLVANAIPGTYWYSAEAMRAAVLAEREACANICDTGVDTPHPTVKDHVMRNFAPSPTLAAAIRLRSNAELCGGTSATNAQLDDGEHT